MNTRIYMKNPNGKNHMLSLELEGGFTMSKLAKGYKTQHTQLCQPPSYTVHTHPLSTNSTLKPSSSKKEKLCSTQTLYLSRENKWNTLLT